MKRYLFVLSVISICISSCSSPASLEQQFTGTWDMYKVYEADTDVTDQHNPEGNRYIIFNTDGTFESGGDPFGKNTGNWSVNEETGVLFIDSSVDDDDSEWNVSFEGDKAIWTGIGDPRKETFKLIHVKRN